MRITIEIIIYTSSNVCNLGETMRKTKEEAEKTREAILKAALRVFSDKGYAGTRLSDIAAEMGVTRGAIYWHFKDKQDLYESLISNVTGRTDDIFKQAMAMPISPLMKIQTIMERFLTLLQSDEEFRAVNALIMFKNRTTESLMQSNCEIRSQIEKRVQAISQLFEEGKRIGEIRPDVDDMDIAWVGTCFVHGVISFWLFDSTIFDIKAKAKSWVDILINGIAVNPTDR